MKFSDLALNPLLLKALQACDYTQPTPIQAKVIPLILQGKDVIAAAPTGTGKTASFVLPVLDRLSAAKRRAAPGRPRILILTPTRELAEQITKSALSYGRFLNFSISTVIGGMGYQRQLNALTRPLDIIVATPGRLMDYIENHNLNLSSVDMLVLDEADRMLDMGFIHAVKKIIQCTASQRQTLLFSATFDQRIANLTRGIMQNPERISIAKEKDQPVNIEQQLFLVKDRQHKSQLLNQLLQSENIYKAIIFSATKRNADKLAKQLCQQGYQAAGLHGDMRQNQRNKVLENMRRDRLQLLVATDVAARGIDITGITHVINYDFPKSTEDYVHRIGRTGRAGQTGVAISMALADEARHVKQVERYTGQRIKIIKDRL